MPAHASAPRPRCVPIYHLSLAHLPAVALRGAHSLQHPWVSSRHIQVLDNLMQCDVQHVQGVAGRFNVPTQPGRYPAVCRVPSGLGDSPQQPFTDSNSLTQWRSACEISVSRYPRLHAAGVLVGQCHTFVGDSSDRKLGAREMAREDGDANCHRNAYCCTMSERLQCIHGERLVMSGCLPWSRPAQYPKGRTWLWSVQLAPRQAGCAASCGVSLLPLTYCTSTPLF